MSSDNRNLKFLSKNFIFFLMANAFSLYRHLLKEIFAYNQVVKIFSIIFEKLCFTFVVESKHTWTDNIG